MAFAGHQHDYALGADEHEYNSTGKELASHISHSDSAERDIGMPNARPTRTFEAPEWIRNLSPEERLEVEEKLKRKIDLRLLPMVILMYIMNYLDRNNIAAARLAGLEEELGLTSVQYSVSSRRFTIDGVRTKSRKL
jgi:hypothetical protein